MLRLGGTTCRHPPTAHQALVAMAREIVYAERTMVDGFSPSTATSGRDSKAILEWLALAHGRTGAGDAEELAHQLLLLRQSSTPTGQRTKLLDLLHRHAERIVYGELPELREITLPVARKLRQRVGAIQECLETLAQEYLDTLSEFLDPRNSAAPRTTLNSLVRAMQCVAWHIRISNLLAAPSGAGIWQQLHAVYRTARRLGLADAAGPQGEPSIQRTYVNVLLGAIAQPASFCPAELQFIADYIDQCVKPVDVLESPPMDRSGVFWVDMERDFPAFALSRRQAPSDTRALYFACDIVARDTRAQLAALTRKVSAASLGLPDFADTPAGRGVLRRLSLLWGSPAARRFPRRRQSYRVNLCAGLQPLWELIRHPEQGGSISEWMVTNESPDGYALMHMSGQTFHLRVGDLVAIQPTGERAEREPQWHVGIVRWAISENPEHIEIGIQQLAPHAIAAEVIRPPEDEAGNLSALILPEMPPMRMLPALVTATGQLDEPGGSLILLVERDNIGIREVRPTALTEQTSSIEIFSVVPDERL